MGWLLLQSPNVNTTQALTYPPEDVPVNTATSTNFYASTTVEVQRYTEEYIVKLIKQTFPNEPIMVAVARCESELNPGADRLGIDGGLFQVNQIHLPRLNQLGLDRYDLHDNLAYAKILHNESGLQPWYMSRHCWAS